MSADNWAVCPRCVARAKKAEAKALAKVTGSYGKIPVAEFDAARAAIKPVRDEDYRTFREDYEISGASDGVVTVDYSGHCSTCGLGLNFKDDHPIPEAEEG